MERNYLKTAVASNVFRFEFKLSSAVSELRVDDHVVFSVLDVLSINSILAEVPDSVLPASRLQSMDDSGILTSASRSVDVGSILVVGFSSIDSDTVDEFASLGSQPEVSSRVVVGVRFRLSRNHVSSQELDRVSERSRFVGGPMEVLSGVLADFPLVGSSVGEAVRIPVVVAFGVLEAAVLALVDGARIPVFASLDEEALSVNT